ncbi:hypothetical protein PR048_016364 [Dryococelus australis]|uniref:DUF4817 domain-containing protein n=1 Tax=Dryococelus australis TaxID=614101 RepID=A0ABQ9HJJ3_9NEOP|nr:hypothetical protein PR048_016364 [Dryococelus australis]
MTLWRGEYEAVSECKDVGNCRSPRKPADQRHRPMRFLRLRLSGNSNQRHQQDAGTWTAQGPPFLSLTHARELSAEVEGRGDHGSPEPRLFTSCFPRARDRRPRGPALEYSSLYSPFAVICDFPEALLKEAKFPWHWVPYLNFAAASRWASPFSDEGLLVVGMFVPVQDGLPSYRGSVGELVLRLHGTKRKPDYMSAGPRKYDADYNSVHRKVRATRRLTFSQSTWAGVNVGRGAGPNYLPCGQAPQFSFAYKPAEESYENNQLAQSSMATENMKRGSTNGDKLPNLSALPWRCPAGNRTRFTFVEDEHSGHCVTAALTTSGKAQCLLWFHEARSPIAVQRLFRGDYGRDPPNVTSTKGWYDKFKETGSVGDKTRSGRSAVSDESVEVVPTAVLRICGNRPVVSPEKQAYVRALW